MRVFTVLKFLSRQPLTLFYPIRNSANFFMTSQLRHIGVFISERVSEVENVTMM